VKRLLPRVLGLALLLLSTGCGNVFVRGAIETGSTIQGAVSTVQLETEGTVQVTFVTLLQNGTSSTIGFCGDKPVCINYLSPVPRSSLFGLWEYSVNRPEARESSQFEIHENGPC